MAEPHPDLDRDLPARCEIGHLDAPVVAEVDFLAGRSDHWRTPSAAVHPAVTARALLASGSPGDASRVLQEALRSGAGVGSWPLQAIAAAAWCTSRIYVPELENPLEGHLAGPLDEFVVDGQIRLGPRAQLRAYTELARGRLVEASELLATAIDVGDRRAPLWGALARVEAVRVMLTLTETRPDGAIADPLVGGSDMGDRARSNLGAARTFFASAGYTRLGEQVELLADLLGTPHGTRPQEPDPAKGVASPLLGHLSARDDHDWLVGFGVQPPRRVPHRLGLIALRHLLANHDRVVPAVELAALVDHTRTTQTGPGAVQPGAAAPPATQRVLEELRRLRGDDELDPAEFSESVRSVIFDDRARSRITKLLRRTISGLQSQHHVLAEHLDASVTTGYGCAYGASPGVRWILR